jgi:hypothetical protein
MPNYEIIFHKLFPSKRIELRKMQKNIDYGMSKDLVMSVK